MKLYLSLLIYGLFAVNAIAQQQPGSSSQGPVRVATALNHLTVLEFHEPVTLAAAGSADFQIERQESKVFIKPMRSGVSTDLFVWTASRRFVYELDTQEVQNMNFAIDNPAPALSSPSPASREADEFADMMLSRAFLGSEVISNSGIHARKNEVHVRVEQVFRTRTTIYVRYTLENRTKRTYHIATPSVQQIEVDPSQVSGPELLHKQIDPRVLEELGSSHGTALPIGHAETASEDVAPGKTTQGIVAIRRDLNSPAVVQLVFAPKVKAAFVL